MTTKPTKEDDELVELLRTVPGVAGVAYLEPDVPHRCSACEFVSVRFVQRCLVCRRWSTMYRAPGAIPTKIKAKSKFAGLGAKSKDADAGGDEVVSMADAMADLANLTLSRLRTFEPFDYVTDGGPVTKCSYLMLGDRGGGKTRLCLQICGGFVDENPDDVAMFASAEMDLSLLVNTAKEVGVPKTDRLVFLPLPNKRTDRVLEAADRRKPKLLIFDSLQAYSGDPVDNLTRVRAWLAKNHAVGILMTHMNKEGIAAGSNKIQQDPDGVYELRRDGDGGPERLLECVQKNRGGNDALGAELRFDAHGRLEVVGLYDMNARKRGQDARQRA